MLTDDERLLIDEFTEELKLPTQRHYIREISQFRAFIDKPLFNATREEAERYIHDELKKQNKDRKAKAPTTRQRIYHQILGFYGFLFEKKLVNTNIFQQVDKPKASKQVKRERSPDFQQVEKLLIALRNEFSLRDYVLVALIATTGLKLSEAINIKWTHFMFNDPRFVTLKVLTGDKERQVAILDVVWDLIERYREEYLLVGEDYKDLNCYLFVNSSELDNYGNKDLAVNMKPITPDWIRQVLVAACKKADIPLFTAKDLRHAHAMFALKLGASTEEVKEQLGWCDPNLAYRYHGTIELIRTPANLYTERYFRDLIKEDE